MCVFFFKQKTAYEMRISDWSSDVCSSDLRRVMIHKSTEFREEEALGCFDALPTCNEIDLVQVVADVGWRGAKWDRDRKYPEKQIDDRFPVRRGSLLGIGDRKALLWIPGEVDLKQRTHFQGGNRQSGG